VAEEPEQDLAGAQSSDQPAVTGTGRRLTPTFATLQFDQSPGTAVLAVRVQQPNVVAEVGPPAQPSGMQAYDMYKKMCRCQCQCN